MCRSTEARRPAVWMLALALAWLALPTAAGAQVSTATIQGTVSDDAGVLPGASVVARHVQSGFTHETATAEDGTFTLAGLRPGQYRLTVAFAQYKPEAKTVEVLVGQTVTVYFRVTPDVIYTEDVTVVGETRLVDTRKSEVTTNVTREQIQHLPQNSRNFLNFAALAPGVRVSDNETRKEFSAGALPSQNVNVFIDGVSFKNDVIDGGVVGQDASRGNPFPQNAVQEFQVLTQNFKAEYEKAASAIITAVTKSGGNRYSGEVFGFYQDKGLVENETVVRDAAGLLVKGKTTPKPTFERWQWGASVGGPIVQDKVQFFGSYEENRQDRDSTVIAGTVSNAPPALVERLRTFEGTFTSPFREKLLFGKVSMQPASAQQLEVTYNWRDETDIRGFGGRTSFESAENVRNRVDSVQGKWQLAATSFLNETYVSYQRYRWNPTAENPGIIGQNYDGLLRIGGRDTDQHIVQQRISLRNDYSRFSKWRGNHTVKGGGVLSYVDYDVSKLFAGNPIFTYAGSISWDFPARAQFGVGDPDLSATNSQLGFFAQDDWAATSRLTLNLGLRWDYESDMLNNDYVTPDNVREATASFVDGGAYFTDGDDRPPYYGMWQPRLGFSYDMSGDGQTIAFGGWGRYFDRVLYNSTLDERFRLQYAVRTFQFSAAGGIRDGVDTIPWDPSFLSVQGLQTLIARGRAPNPEVFLIANDTKPPVSDQWSLGVRHSFGGIVTSVTYSGMRSRNLFTFLFGNRRPDGTCCQPVPGFSNILRSDLEGRKSWYDGLYVQADRPYGIGGTRYGFSVTYTLGKAEKTGGDLFSLDFPTAADYPRHPIDNDERHRLVVTGIVGLPWDFIASTFITLGSGTPYTIVDESLGNAVDLRRVRRNEGRPEQFDFIVPNAWAFRSVDLQVERAFRFAERHAVSVIFQGFNIFSFDNFTGYEGFIPTLPATNPNFGRPSSLIDPGRRLQLGVRYGF
ncbi:MAG: TonB-dependent receptor [Acidobacteria bacterium]|nr:TonB-dependent receptor [Acidobacteriota bacterium]